MVGELGSFLFFFGGGLCFFARFYITVYFVFAFIGIILVVYGCYLCKV